MDQKQSRRGFIARALREIKDHAVPAVAVAGVAGLVLAEEAEAGCAWYYTGYRECRGKFFCNGGVAWYYQQAYYCSDRRPGPLSYRFVMGGCGCNPWE
jgi:hypothetical protein